MNELTLLFSLVFSVTLLLVLVLRYKMQAFLALILASVCMGLMAGMPFQGIIDGITEGMGGTLGFVAVVVGLGAIFGQILETSGGAQALADRLIKTFGKEKVPWALSLTGFFIGIPIFLDVGFIIMIPVLYSLSRETKRSLLTYAIPLLAGLAVTHAFVPPTPGPVAVSEILGADMGYVILYGILIGFPVAALAGPLFGRYISRKIYVLPPSESEISAPGKHGFPPFWQVACMIGLPLFLIVANTVSGAVAKAYGMEDMLWVKIAEFIGHPFLALTIATLMAIYFLGIKRGFSREEILNISTKSLAPAGVIILITGAGGVLKQLLIDSGIGNMLAEYLSNAHFSPLVLAWLLAMIVRITQGSATVAMITSAGIMAPMLGAFSMTPSGCALMVIAIAAGATTFSHVNDSGFWLVCRYLGLTEKQALSSWSIMETIISFFGFGLVLLISFFV
ncbi:MAG: gluconate:H+ symporter [Bacteroidales bacterium]|nr:gluconate:H+ symporter [Bacteroidales bacterium]